MRGARWLLAHCCGRAAMSPGEAAAERPSSASRPVRLLCAPSGAGKTTALLRHAERLRGRGELVRGIVCPASGEAGRRVLVLLSSNVELQLQLNDGRPCPACAGSGCEDIEVEQGEFGERRTVAVGNFIFDAAAFDAAEAELLDAQEDSSWVVMDEVGPLELRRKQGLHAAVEVLLARRRAGGLASATLCVVVRPSLRTAFLETYGLAEAEVEDLSLEALAHGLV